MSPVDFNLMSQTHIVIILLSGLCGYLILSYLRDVRSRQRVLHFPPGPPRRIPWVGNALEMPPENQHLAFHKWAKEYGDVVYLEAFGQPMVILASMKACSDLLDKRSVNFSDRPRMPMLNELMGWDFAFSLMKYGDEWRKHRRTFHQYFNVNQVATWQPIQIRSARALLVQLHSSPQNFLAHLRNTLGATIMEVMYGIKIADENDKYILKAEQAMGRFAHAGHPATYLVNTFHWMKHIPSWIPGAQFKHDAKVWKAYPDEMCQWPFDYVLEEISKGTAKPSVLAMLLDRIPDGADMKKEMKMIRNVAGLGYAGGGDTTIGATHIFFLAMALYPDAQRTAQKEIDELTRGLRLPDFNDRESLPYLSAVCKEIIRWQPIVPCDFVHTSVKDDEYRGWHLPAGTYFFGNTWSILHDPEEYPDPESFIPDRFMKDGQLDPNRMDPTLAAFGYGRRICPGRYLADSSLWSIVATVLAVYDIKPPVDENGKLVQLKPRMSTRFIQHPLPFECIITPRSCIAEELIRECEIETADN